MIHLVNRVRRYSGEGGLYLVMLSAFCIALLITRMVYTESFVYRFMGFNLFLAWIPFVISKFILRPEIANNIFLKIFLFAAWLVFFPNAAYMTTDIMHLYEFPSVPVWYDLIMLFSFAWCGIMLGFYSLKMICSGLFGKGNLIAEQFFVCGIFFLGGIGIYLGRFYRWNSWDLILEPKKIFFDTAGLLTNTSDLLNMFSLALVFAVLLSLIYFKLFSPVTGKSLTKINKS